MYIHITQPLCLLLGVLQRCLKGPDLTAPAVSADRDACVPSKPTRASMHPVADAKRSAFVDSAGVWLKETGVDLLMLLRVHSQSLQRANWSQVTQAACDQVRLVR